MPSLMFLVNSLSESNLITTYRHHFDAKTFRHELCFEYKANRGEMPEDLSVQIPYLYRLFRPWLLYKVPGSRHDPIGSVVHQCLSELHCYVLSVTNFRAGNEDVSFTFHKKPTPKLSISMESSINLQSSPTKSSVTRSNGRQFR